MSNFSYLSTRPEYSLFASAAIEAEKVFSTSPAMCAVGCRKALELAVKWVYAADKTITMPYKDNLQSLLHEPSFRFAVDRNVWSVLPSIVKAGNLAKFSQNRELWGFLRSTKNRILVEASPRDRIWGIGMGKSNPDAQCPVKWKGTNLLGFALTEARDILMEQEKEA